MTHYSIKELVNCDPEIERSLRLRRKRQALSSQSIACEGMENQEVENINPPEVPPPVQIEDQFDEVAPSPTNKILRDYARPDRFNCESSVRKPPVAANNFEIRTGLIQTIQQSFIFTRDASEDPHSHLIDFLELVETAKYNGVPREAIKLRLFPFSLKGDAKTWLRSLPQESVYQAWERLKAMLRKYPHHDIPEHMQLYIFYHGLKPSSRNVIEAAAGGSVNTQQPSQSEACDMCGGNHQNYECQATNHNDEHVNVIGYKQYLFGSPMAQKHPGFQWSNPNGVENSQSFQKQQIQEPCQQRPKQAHSSLDDLLYKYIKVTDEKMESQNSSLKNLEIQLSQLATLVSEKIQGPLPSNTKKNPKEHLKAITVRLGKELDEPYADQSEQQVNNGKNVEIPSKPSQRMKSRKKKKTILKN
ncbi:uncharacterized protein [Nicotiana sylvestris]|uniref:uncharacterized protein n=1 Tax=Nicotiana sylvestris TaxID=4096 RepID=UPI00388CA4C5